MVATGGVVKEEGVKKFLECPCTLLIPEETVKRLLPDREVTINITVNGLCDETSIKRLEETLKRVRNFRGCCV